MCQDIIENIHMNQIRLLYLLADIFKNFTYVINIQSLYI